MKRSYIALIQSLDPLRRLIEDVKASAGLKCPSCDDVGWYVGYLGAEPEKIQCEFCYTVADSIFNRRMAENPLPNTDGG